jgi:hypothetical protein
MTKRNRLILLALPTVVAAIILVVILNWHIPTRVRITLTTDRIFFKVGGADQATILDSVGLKSVVIEKFETIKLKPESLLRLRHGTVGSNTLGTSNLPIAQVPVVITPRAGRSQSNVTFAPDGSAPGALLVMDAINAKPGTEVILENTEDSGNVILRVDGQRSSGSIVVAVPFTLALDQSDLAGIKSTPDLSGPLTLRGKLLRDSSIEFSSQDAALILTVTVPPEKSTALLPQGHMLVTALKFERLEPDGKVLSSLTRDTTCEISYPDYEDKITKATVTKPDFLLLDDLQTFSVEEMTYNPEKKGISIRLLGVANKITSGSQEYKKDHRLTVYNALWNNHKVIAIFAVLWVAGTTAGFYKFYKDS